MVCRNCIREELAAGFPARLILCAECKTKKERPQRKVAALESTDLKANRQRLGDIRELDRTPPAIEEPLDPLPARLKAPDPYETSHETLPQGSLHAKDRQDAEKLGLTEAQNYLNETPVCKVCGQPALTATGKKSKLGLCVKDTEIARRSKKTLAMQNLRKNGVLFEAVVTSLSSRQPQSTGQAVS